MVTGMFAIVIFVRMVVIVIIALKKKPGRMANVILGEHQILMPIFLTWGERFNTTMEHSVQGLEMDMSKIILTLTNRGI